jgi:hypothetical protein
MGNFVGLAFCTYVLCCSKGIGVMAIKAAKDSVLTGMAQEFVGVSWWPFTQMVVLVCIGNCCFKSLILCMRSHQEQHTTRKNVITLFLANYFSRYEVHQHSTNVILDI